MSHRRNFPFCHRRCSIKIGVFTNFSKFTAKQLCQSLFFTRIAQLYWKRDSGTSAFLRILRNFEEHLFYRTRLGEWFYVSSKNQTSSTCSYKLKLGSCLIIPVVSLEFSPAFQNIEATFERYSTKVVVRQNQI